jgi:putative transposase
MNGTVLLETLQGLLPGDVIEAAANDLGVVQRERKLDVARLVASLVLSNGSDDIGVLAEAHRRYNSGADDRVVRGAFYSWLDDELARLMERLLQRALDHVATLPPLLPGVLGASVTDWRVFDSETITLRPALADVFPASGSPAGVKVHKELSLGRGCMIDYHLSPAREHDSPHLVVDERYRGMGLLFDLGYVSLKRTRECDEHGVRFVQRLKENWKPRILAIHRGDVRGVICPEADLDLTLADERIALDGKCVDATVVIGKGKQAVTARLVMVPGPEGYLIYLTNLSRDTHGPKQVGDLYRVRWEIEGDNKVDKSGAQLDQIRATTASSVRIQLSAKLLHTLLVDVLVHRDNLERAREKRERRAPLHKLALSYAIRTRHAILLATLLASATTADWDRIARDHAEDARDPNWRRRPSVLDRLLGMTAPRGRPRRKKLRDCRPSAAPYRNCGIEWRMHHEAN